MAKYNGVTIEVTNWEKYNPRSDSKKPTWFRVDNDIATGPGFFGLDCEQKWLWIVILSLVSQKNGGPIVWNSLYVESLTGISEDKQNSTIEIFEKFVRLRVSRKVTSRTRKVTSDSSPATNERTNITNERNVTNSVSPGLSRKGVDECLAELDETHRVFKINKDPKLDEVAVARLIQQHGAEKTKLAIRGARFEKPTETFKPKDHFSLIRISEPKLFEKLVNLGAQQTEVAGPKTDDFEERINRANQQLRDGTYGT